MYQKWGRGGLAHLVVQSLFRAFARQALLPEDVTAAEFAAYVGAAGQELSVLRAVAGL